MNATANATSNETRPVKHYPGYRAAWEDCGGAGANDTWRMRSISAKIKGWAKPRRFIRHAAQDAHKVHPSGTKPGPGDRTVYPAADVHRSIREGLAKAEKTLRR